MHTDYYGFQPTNPQMERQGSDFFNGYTEPEEGESSLRETLSTCDLQTRQSGISPEGSAQPSTEIRDPRKPMRSCMSLQDIRIMHVTEIKRKRTFPKLTTVPQKHREEQLQSLDEYLWPSYGQA